MVNDEIQTPDILDKNQNFRYNVDISFETCTNALCIIDMKRTQIIPPCPNTFGYPQIVIDLMVTVRG